VGEAKGRDFYDRDDFEARTRQSLPHVRDVVNPLAERGLSGGEFADSGGAMGRLKAWVCPWLDWTVVGSPADDKFFLRRRGDG